MCRNPVRQNDYLAVREEARNKNIGRLSVGIVYLTGSGTLTKKSLDDRAKKA